MNRNFIYIHAYIQMCTYIYRKREEEWRERNLYKSIWLKTILKPNRNPNYIWFKGVSSYKTNFSLILSQAVSR